jgi:hypothetical protein
MKRVENIVGAPVSNVMLHDIHGGGFPDYVKHAETLYTVARDTALTDAKSVPDVRLVANEP